MPDSDFRPSDPSDGIYSINKVVADEVEDPRLFKGAIQRPGNLDNNHKVVADKVEDSRLLIGAIQRPGNLVNNHD